MAAALQTALLVVPDSGQDRALALPQAGASVVAVADGAGGTAHAAAAAQRVIERVREAPPCTTAAGWCQLLLELDQELSGSGGETTAVVARVDERVTGASVGDSQAWLLGADAAVDLTALQRRKPLLGSGVAVPAPFDVRRGAARVLFGSDGLFKYAAPETIRALAAQAAPEAAVAALARCVQLPSGALHDDVAIVIVSA